MYVYVYEPVGDNCVNYHGYLMKINQPICKAGLEIYNLMIIHTLSENEFCYAWLYAVLQLLLLLIILCFFSSKEWWTL